MTDVAYGMSKLPKQEEINLRKWDELPGFLGELRRRLLTSLFFLGNRNT
jgi:hypothetical protein